VSRLFFALWPEDAQREMLALAVHDFVRASGGRPVPTHNLHITLAFLGSVPEGRIPELSSIARAVASGCPAGVLPIAITFDEVEHWRKAQIVCAVGRPVAYGGRETGVGRAADGPREAGEGRVACEGRVLRGGNEIAAAGTERGASVPGGSAVSKGTAPPGADWLAKTLQDEAARAGFAPDLKPFRPHVTVARKVLRPTRSRDIHSVRWEFVRFALLESRTQASGPVYSVVESYALCGNAG
jgi:2'-5' RNA ligase